MPVQGQGSDGSGARSPDTRRSTSGENLGRAWFPEKTPRTGDAEDPPSGLGGASLAEGEVEASRSERGVARASLRGVSKRRAASTHRKSHEERPEGDDGEAGEGSADNSGGKEKAHRSSRRRRGRPEVIRSGSEDGSSLPDLSAVSPTQDRKSSSPTQRGAGDEVRARPVGGETAAPSEHGASRTETRHSSRYRGVQWDRSSRRWRARIHADRTRHIGYFERERDAGAAWDITALRHFGLDVAKKLNFPEESLAKYRAELEKEEHMRAKVAEKPAPFAQDPNSSGGNAEQSFGLAIALETRTGGNATETAGPSLRAHAVATAPLGMSWSAGLNVRASLTQEVGGQGSGETMQTLRAGIRATGAAPLDTSPMSVGLGMPRYAALGAPHAQMLMSKASAGPGTGGMPQGPPWAVEAFPIGQPELRYPSQPQGAIRVTPGQGGYPTYYQPSLAGQVDLQPMHVQQPQCPSQPVPQLHALPFVQGRGSPRVDDLSFVASATNAATDAHRGPYRGTVIGTPAAPFAGAGRPHDAAFDLAPHLGGARNAADFSGHSPIRTRHSESRPIVGILERPSCSSGRRNDWDGSLDRLHLEMQHQLSMRPAVPPASQMQGCRGPSSSPTTEDHRRLSSDGSPIGGHRALEGVELACGQTAVASDLGPSAAAERAPAGAEDAAFYSAPAAGLRAPCARSFAESSLPVSTAVFPGRLPQAPPSEVAARGMSYTASPPRPPPPTLPASLPSQQVCEDSSHSGGAAGSGGFPSELAWSAPAALERADVQVSASAPSQASLHRTWSAHAMRRPFAPPDMERSFSHPGAVANSSGRLPGASLERLGVHSRHSPLTPSSDIRAVAPDAWVARIAFDLGTYPSQAAAEAARERAAGLLGGLTFAPPAAVGASMAGRSGIGNDTAVVRDSKGFWYAVLEIRGRFFKFGPFDTAEKATATHDRCSMVLGGFLAPTVAHPWKRLLNAGEFAALIEAINATRRADGISPLPSTFQNEAPRATNVDIVAPGGLFAGSATASGSRESGAGNSPLLPADGSASHPSSGAAIDDRGIAFAKGCTPMDATSTLTGPQPSHSVRLGGYPKANHPASQSSQSTSLRAARQVGDVRDLGVPAQVPQTAVLHGAEPLPVQPSRAAAADCRPHAMVAVSEGIFDAGGLPAPQDVVGHLGPVAPPVDACAGAMPASFAPSQPDPGAGLLGPSPFFPPRAPLSGAAGQPAMSGAEFDVFCGDAARGGLERTFLDDVSCVPPPASVSPGFVAADPVVQTGRSSAEPPRPHQKADVSMHPETFEGL